MACTWVMSGHQSSLTDGHFPLGPKVIAAVLKRPVIGRRHAATNWRSSPRVTVAKAVWVGMDMGLTLFG